MTNLTTKCCLECGRWFEGMGKQKICSDECRKIRAREKERERREKAKRQREDRPYYEIPQKPKKKNGTDPIARVAIAARKRGLSYGKFVAKYSGNYYGSDKDFDKLVAEILER